MKPGNKGRRIKERKKNFRTFTVITIFLQKKTHGDRAKMRGNRNLEF